MPEDAGHTGSDWSQRIDRLLSGTTVEQVRDLIDEMRAGLDRLSSTFGEQLSGATAGMDEVLGTVRGDMESVRTQMTTLADRLGAVEALREDLVRSLEAVGAAQREAIAAAQRDAAEAARRDERPAPEEVLGPRLEQLADAIGGLGGDLRDVRSDLSGVSEDLGGVAGRIGVVEGLREDLVRALEAVGAAQREAIAAAQREREADRPEVDVEAIVQAQAERVLGGFAQRVGQLQTLIGEARDGLGERLDALERSALAEREQAERPPTSEEIAAAVGDAVRAPSADEVAAAVGEALRARLEEIDVAVRTDIDAGFRERAEADSKQVDALGLRITNMAMSVNQALDAVRAQVDAIAERARTLDAEQGAILEAVREQVAGIGERVGEEVGRRTAEISGTVSDRIDALEAPLRAASEAGDAIADVARLGERLRAMEELLGTMGDRVSMLSERAVPLEEATERAIESMRDELRDQLEQMKAEIATPDARLQVLDGLDERIGEVARGAVASVADAVGELVDAKLAPLQQLDAKLTPLEQLDAKLGGLEQRLEAIDEKATGAASVREDLRDLPEMALKLGAIPQLEEQVGRVERALEPVAGILQRLDALARIEERLGAVDELAVVLARVQGDVAAVPSLHEQVRSLVEAAGGDATREAIAALDRLRETLPESLREQLHATTDALREDVQAARASIDGLPEATSSAIESKVAALEAPLAAMSERIDASLAAMSERIDASLAPVASMGEKLDAMEQAGSRLEESVERPLSRLAARLDGIEAAIARTIIEVREALGEVKEGSQGASDRLEGTLSDLVTKVAGLDEATGSIRAHLSALPGPSEIASVVSTDMGGAIGSVRSAMEGRLGGLERDLGGLATNVNEIWMRVRALAQGVESLTGSLDEQRQLTEQRAGATDEVIASVARREERLERLLADLDARGDERISRRLGELESRIVAAARGIESERDRLFVAAFDEVVERVSRGDRTFGKRLRSLVGRSSRARSTPEAAPPTAPEAEAGGGTAAPEAIAPTSGSGGANGTAKRTKATRAAASAPPRASAKKAARTKKTTAKTKSKAGSKKKTSAKRSPKRAAKTTSRARASQRKNVAANDEPSAEADTTSETGPGSSAS